jgi:hypothetical protein
VAAQGAEASAVAAEESDRAEGADHRGRYRLRA